jgi:hypothetical protein
LSADIFLLREFGTGSADRLSPAIVTLKGCTPSEVSREQPQTCTLDIRSFTPSRYRFLGTSYPAEPMKPFTMAGEGPRLHPWRSTGYSSIKQGCVMPIDTISVKCRRDAHPCVVRNSTSALRKRAYGAPLPSAVPGVRRSVRQKRHEPGNRPLA